MNLTFPISNDEKTNVGQIVFIKPAQKCVVLGGSGGAQVGRIRGGLQKQKERRRQDATSVIIRKETLWNSIKMPKSTLLLVVLFSALYSMQKFQCWINDLKN